jgi:hypothetical protein
MLVNFVVTEGDGKLRASVPGFRVFAVSWLGSIFSSSITLVCSFRLLHNLAQTLF